MDISDDERELFRRDIGQVRRVRSARVAQRPTPPEAEPVQSRRDEAEVLRELAVRPFSDGDTDTGEALQWLRPGLRPRLLRRLQRGHFAVADELDLHQMNTNAAGASIRWFLEQARSRDLSCVKIIHGKGLRSGPDGPKLKRLTARLLSRDPSVLAFAGARPADGGSGAVYVLLGQRR